MVPTQQHVDSLYICFSTQPQTKANLPSTASNATSEKSTKVYDKLNAEKHTQGPTQPESDQNVQNDLFYLNYCHSTNTLNLAPFHGSIWTIVPFSSHTFYIEVTLTFGSAPLHLSLTKNDQFMLTSFATDATLFCQRKVEHAIVLCTVSDSGPIRYVSMSKSFLNRKPSNTSVRYGIEPSDDGACALPVTFSYVSHDEKPLASLDGEPYRRKCLEHFLHEPSDRPIECNAISTKILNRPSKDLPEKGTISAESFWTARGTVRDGTVLCTHQNDIFRELFVYTENLTRLRNLPSTNWEKKSLDSHINASVSVLLLGHPRRSFPTYLIFALANIPDGAPIIPQFSFPESAEATREAPVSISGWPEDEPYFHGIGRHTCGSPHVGYPLRMVQVRECPHIGRGQKELVAASPIPKGTVFPYTGALSDRCSPYSWFTSAGYNVLGGGVMRYANLYFGFAPFPNAALVDLRFSFSHGIECPVLGVALLRDVKQGEPILIRSYGRDADFEVLRRTVCRGNYLELERFPPAMRIPGLESREQWYLPGDIVITKGRSSTKKTMEIKLYSLLTMTNKAIMGVPLQKCGTQGVDFTLTKGQKPERLNLRKCILLIPDEDYDIIQRQPVRREGTNPMSCTEASRSSLHEAECEEAAEALHPHSWEIGKNRGAISSEALTAAMTPSRNMKPKEARKREDSALITIRLSRSVYFVLFSSMETSHNHSLETFADVNQQRVHSAQLYSRTQAHVTPPRHGSSPAARRMTKYSKGSIDAKHIVPKALDTSLQDVLEDETIDFFESW